MRNKDVLIEGLIKEDALSLDTSLDTIIKKSIVINERTYYDVGGIDADSLIRWGINADSLNDDYFNILIPYQINNRIIKIDHNILLETEKHEIIRPTGNLGNIITFVGSQFTDIIDQTSDEGQLLLFKTLLFKYRGATEVPNELLEKTKIANYRFSRKKTSVQEDVPFSKVVGTTHPKYSGLSWFEIFQIFERPKNITLTILNDQTLEILRENKKANYYDPVNFYRIDDEYFTNEGSHRTTLSKIIGLDYMNAHVEVYETDHEYADAYERLKGQGFKITIPTRDDFYKRFGKHVKEKWEVFIIDFDNAEKVELIGFENIKQFLDFISDLTPSKVIKIKFRNLIGKKYKNYLEKCCHEYVDRIVKVINNIQ